MEIEKAKEYFFEVCRSVINDERKQELSFRYAAVMFEAAYDETGSNYAKGLMQICDIIDTMPVNAVKYIYNKFGGLPVFEITKELDAKLERISELYNELKQMDEDDMNEFGDQP